MALGDSRIRRLDLMFAGSGEAVEVRRAVAGGQQEETIFGTPLNPVEETFTVDIIVADDEENLLETIAGGKPTITLKFGAPSGVLQTADEFAYSGDTYKVKSVRPAKLDGLNVMDTCEACREVRQ